MKFKNIKFLIIVGVLTALLVSSETVIKLTGTVQYDGKVPTPKQVNMAADAMCGKAHSGPVFNESFLVNKDKFMKNVVKNVLNQFFY